MKIIHQNGYTTDELFLYRLTVIKNLVDSAQAIVLALRKFKIEVEVAENRVSSQSYKMQESSLEGMRTSMKPSLIETVKSSELSCSDLLYFLAPSILSIDDILFQECADVILQHRVDADPGTTLDPSLVKAIESLWHDPCIPAIMEKSSEFYLMDSAP